MELTNLNLLTNILKLNPKKKTKNALFELKECILKVEPNATELFNYNIPAYALTEGGKREQQIMIAGYKKHVGLYPHPTTMEKFASELSGYKRGKGSVQFPLDEPLPKELIVRMIKYRVELLKKVEKHCILSNYKLHCGVNAVRCRGSFPDRHVLSDTDALRNSLRTVCQP